MGYDVTQGDLRQNLEALLRESLAAADETRFFETAAHIAMAVDAFRLESESRPERGSPTTTARPN